LDDERVVDTEPLDRGEDVVGGFDPLEGLWIGVVLIDEGYDVSLQFGYPAMNTAAARFVGEQSESSA
jgi:hypothetical protein